MFDSIISYQLPLVPRVVTNETVTFEPFSELQLGGKPVGAMDSVMGGISRGSWISKSNTFFGKTLLANNGGFALLRWRSPNVHNWSYATGIYIKGLKHYKAPEHMFRIILRDATCERFKLTNFKAVFATPEQVDQPLLIPFSVLGQMEQMGTAMVESPVFNPIQITEIWLMAIKPTVVGEFQFKFTEWGLYTI